MKYTYILFILFFASCSTTNKTYMCGDRECLDRKEFKEYFAKNLTVEIQVNNKKKKSSVDLVKLNTNNATHKTKEKKSELKSEKINKKAKKIKLKEEKANLKAIRKAKEIKEKNRIKEKKNLAKLKIIEEKKRVKKMKNLTKLKTIEPSNEITAEENILKIKKKNDLNIINSPKTVSTVKKNTKLTSEKIIKKKPINNEEFKSIVSKNQTSICEGIKDCDIDKITELLIKKGRQKNFPDITSK